MFVRLENDKINFMKLFIFRPAKVQADPFGDENGFQSVDASGKLSWADSIEQEEMQKLNLTRPNHS